MKKIYFLLILIIITYSNSVAQLTIVDAVAVDGDGDGYYATIEIEFSAPVNDSEFEQSAITDDEWEFSEFSDFSTVILANNFYTDVNVISNENTANDRYVRITTQSQFSSSNGPIYIRYTNGDPSADSISAYYSPTDILADFSSYSATDNSPPAIYNSSYNPSSGIVGVGEKIELTFNFEGSETLITADNITFNGTNVSSDSLIEVGSGEYHLNYWVAEGDNDISDSDTIPFSIVFSDTYGNTITYTDSPGSGSCPGIDANTPVISSVVFDPGDGTVLEDNDQTTIYITMQGGDAGLTSPYFYVNGRSRKSWSNDGGGNYSAVYEVDKALDPEIDDPTERLPFKIVFSDGANETDTLTEADLPTDNTPGVSITKPVIDSILFIPGQGDTLGIGDTLTVILYAAGESGLTGELLEINNTTLYNESLYDSLNGNYSCQYIVKEGDTDVADNQEITIDFILTDGTKTSDLFDNDDIVADDCPAIDANRPTIIDVVFSTGDGNTIGIGTSINIDVNASDNTGLTVSEFMVNNVDVSGSFVEDGSEDYRVVYSVSQGDNDIDDAARLPLSIILSDGRNFSVEFTEDDLPSDNSPGVDANRPAVKSVTYVPGHGNTLGIDSVLTVILEAENAESGLNASGMTVNGVDVAGSLTPEGTPGFYTLEYTVQNGHGSINDGTQAIPVSFAFTDDINSTLPAFTNSTILSTPGIDDTAPGALSVSLSPNTGIVGIGDTILITITAVEDGLQAKTISFNNKNLKNKFEALGGGTNQYTAEYVIKEGDNEVDDASDIPISFILNDEAGNPSPEYNILAAGNCPGIDSDKPQITDIAVSPTIMRNGQTYTITITINSDANNLNLVSGTIAGFNLTNLSYVNATTYEADFTVSTLGYDILDGDSYNVTNLVLSDAGGNLSNTYSETISQVGDPIYTILPTAKVRGKYNVCDQDSAELTIQLTGYAPWDVDLYDGSSTTTINGISESPFIYKVEALDVNGSIDPDTMIYKITQVTDDNGNNKVMPGTDSAMVFAYKLPVVDITDPPGNKTYNINAEVDTLEGSPVGGVFSGNGIVSSNNTFLASSAGLGTHKIAYTYTISATGCWSSDTVEFDVIESNADISFDNSDDDWRCDYEATMEVTAEVITNPAIIGSLKLYSNPTAITDHGNNTATVDISQLTEGTYQITFVYIDGTAVSVNRSFTVESVSTSINITDVSDYCEDHDTIFVDAFNLTPVGGTGQFTFSGNADDYFVDDPDGNSLYFFPDSLDPGSYNLQYTYTTPNGCVSSPKVKNFDVFALPTVSFTMNSVYNIDQGASTINGSPLGATGVFTPLSFMSNNGDGTANFDPADAGLGNHWVKYTYEDGNTCVNVDSTQIEVTEALGDISSSSGSFQFCYWGSDIDTIIGTPIPTDGTAGSFYIDNVLITAVDDNKILFNPKDYLSGDHTVRYEYYNGPTLYKVFQSINIDSVAEVFFTDIPNQCEDYDTIFVNAFNLIPAGGTGEFIFSGQPSAFDYDPSDSKNNKGYLLPGEISPGNYNLKYLYTSPTTGCKSDTVQKAFEVYTLPTVSFSMNPTYNIDQGSSTINGNPLGATGVFTPLTFMSNNGNGTALFDPADAGLGNHWVKYTYEDGNGCVNSDSVEILVNEALGSVASSKGSFKFCYFGGDIDTLIGTPIPTDGTPGSFYIDNVLIPAVSDNKILINPQDYSPGDHTVKYTYSDGAAPYEVYKTINIDSIGNIYFTGLDPNYCEDEDIEVELTAFYPGQDGSMLFDGNGVTDDINDNLGYFNPSNANLGDNNLSYTFTRDYSGCQKVYNRSVIINKTPQVAFYPNEICVVNPSDPLGFIADTLSTDSIVSWEWTYRTNYKNFNQYPVFTQTVPGYNSMNLKLVSNKGCANDVDSSFYIGTRVDLRFTFENECHGETVIFNLISSSDTEDTLSTNWNFGGVGIEDGSNRMSPTFKYDTPGAYDVVYEEITKSCGRIADTIRINIRPSVDLSVTSYFQDFEENPINTGWVIENYEDGANNTWEWGEPVGTKINSASSGVNAFVTNLDGNYLDDEKGMITSPCFDFSNLSRPMMKMDFLSFTETDRDGVVIQYTKANGDWSTVGIPNDGVNWYNSYIISGTPANQQLGWTGNLFDATNNGWRTAMFSLDELKGRAGVRFRVVFGSNGDFTNEGFAFDNVEFKERERIVLLENFTNSKDGDANEVQDNIITPIVVKDTLDVVSLNYHTSFPNANAFNSYYPSGPSARSLYYGVSGVPYSIVDGLGQFDYFVGQELSKSDINSRVLLDPVFDISLKQDLQGNNLVVSTYITALADITGHELVANVAIVEKSVVSDSKVYYNVLRTMLPDAAGSFIERDWLAGDSINLYHKWELPDGVVADSLITIVFIQDDESKEIYQTQFASTFKTITSIEDDFVNSLAEHDYRIYPNPFSDELTIKLLKTVPYGLKIELYNGLGSLVMTEKLEGNMGLINIETSDLPHGVYYLRISNSDKAISTRKIIKIE